MFSRKQRFFFISLLIVGLIVPLFVSSVSSSSGSIRINSKIASTPGQQVQAGGTINLYFGGVTWSGDSFYLFLSQDGSPQISSGDFVYTPMISAYDLSGTTTKSYSSDNGNWLAGDYWVNGSLPTTLAVGNYYIKAFDQASSSVAVTDTYVNVKSIQYNATLTLTPMSGPGGVPITFTGSGYPPNSPVVISYLDSTFGTWNYLTTVTSNSSGKITAQSEVPDLKRSLSSGDYPETFSTISYRAEIAGFPYSYASYNQYHRGLKIVGNQEAYGLFGDGTNLVSTVRAMVGDEIPLYGKYFHPGVIYVRWDSTDVVGTVTSNEWLNAAVIRSTAAGANGTFSTTFTVPAAASGEHYVAVEDSQQARVIVRIFISQSNLELSPASGPGGATVQFSGSNYPPSTPVTISYLDSEINYAWNVWTTTTSDATGRISFTAEMPDLKKAIGNGEQGETYSTVSFRTEVNGVPYAYVDYYQNWRGLKTVGSQNANYGLYGNGTNLGVFVLPGDNLLISGRWFHPGIVYIRFDGVTVVGTVTDDEWKNAQIIGSTTASASGNFSKTVTIPNANTGEHYISVEDSQTWMVIKVYVGQLNNTTPTPTPTPIPTSTPTATPTPTPTSTPNPTATPTTAPTASPTTNPTPTTTPKPTTPPQQLLTPTIDLTCKGTVAASAFKVELNGKIELNQTALSGVPVLISYSVTNGQSWESLTLVQTEADGTFKAIWTPSVTGNFLVKATVEATSTTNAASKTVTLALTPDSEEPASAKNVFTVNSNSTITQLAFNSTSQVISFKASGEDYTTGYVSIYVPKTLLSDLSTLKTYIDGSQVAFTSQSQGDSWLITITYNHSEHTILMQLTGDSQAPINPPNDSTFWLCVGVAAAIVAVSAVGLFALKRKHK